MKSKVIAIRVTQEQYDLLSWVSVVRKQPVSLLLLDSLQVPFTEFAKAQKEAVRKLEAKAKRDAKKAATDE